MPASRHTHASPASTSAIRLFMGPPSNGVFVMARILSEQRVLLRGPVTTRRVRHRRDFDKSCLGRYRRAAARGGRAAPGPPLGGCPVKFATRSMLIALCLGFAVLAIAAARAQQPAVKARYEKR